MKATNGVKGTKTGHKGCEGVVLAFYLQILGRWWRHVNVFYCSVNADGWWFYLEVVGTPQPYML